MNKTTNVLISSLFLVWSLALGGCVATGMNAAMDNSMGQAATEMKGPVMSATDPGMTVPAGGMMAEPGMESSTMPETPAPITGNGM